MTSLSLDSDWLKRLEGFEHLYVGYSGGLDSTVVLNRLAAYPSLRSKIHAVHVHHGLSPNADAWALHCEQVASALRLPYSVYHLALDASANLEERARDARYQIFESLLGPKDGLVLAHHQSDQCETLLLNLLRGAGVEGLSGMPDQRDCGLGRLLRPFLTHAKVEFQTYAESQQLIWIEDESNASLHWSRSYLRQEIIPRLERRWPAAREKISESAAHCRQAADNLKALASLEGVDIQAQCLTLTTEQTHDVQRLANLLRSWIKTQTHKTPSQAILSAIIQQLIKAKGDALPLVQHGHWQIRRYRQTLYLLSNLPLPLTDCLWINFPQPLVLSNGLVISAEAKFGGLSIPRGTQVEIRGRRGGERIYLQKQHKSLKNLFQEWAIPPWERDQVPLLYVNQQLLAVIGYAALDSPLEEGYTIKVERTNSSLRKIDDSTPN